jgi:hypothetical protein
MSSLLDPTAIAQAFWQGVFQLLALAFVAAFATFIYQRIRARYTLREELIESINQFAISLYKPRKLYQAVIDQTCDPLAAVADSTHREARRLETIYRALEELVAATGQFRALQVKIIPLYGHELEIFAYYMAIWRYLKEIRHRMGRSETLYFHAEAPESPDAFALLIDAFRYRIMLQRFAWRAPVLAMPARGVLEEMRRRGDAVYAEYFAKPAAKPADVPVHP